MSQEKYEGASIHGAKPETLGKELAIERDGEIGKCSGSTSAERYSFFDVSI